MIEAIRQRTKVQALFFHGVQQRVGITCGDPLMGESNEMKVRFALFYFRITSLKHLMHLGLPAGIP